MDDILIYGLSFPYHIAPVFIGYCSYRCLRYLLSKIEISRTIWHRPLFNLSLFVVMTSLVYITLY
ncbi:DUF1656 domain-containing protein [Rouxiella sp. Mn2063]|uniref:DUF1656 domain-containing protein n=1 Tax=Rouxiella sp. Mn2063 TaxID=3395262 RepID=UPI003BDB27DC